MNSGRRLPRDPRTVARDIPGVVDCLFPQLIPGVVRHFNSEAYSFSGCTAIDPDDLLLSKLQPAMLFEIGFAAGEELIAHGHFNWESCLQVATRRQERHFDARLPEAISASDQRVAEQVGRNMATMLSVVCEQEARDDLTRSPVVPGYQWIATGNGDFSLGDMLIEIKCTNRNFSSADYRQILMYWLLSYAASVEGGSSEWTRCTLLNPRLNVAVECNFDDLIQVMGAGRSKVEIVELFHSMVTRFQIAPM